MKELKKFIKEDEIRIEKIKRGEISVKDDLLNIKIQENKKHFIELKTYGNSFIKEFVESENVFVNNKIFVSNNSSLDVEIKSTKGKFVIVYDEIWLGQNSTLDYKFKSKATGKLYHALVVYHDKKSECKVSIRSNVKNKFVSVGKLIFDKNSDNSKGDLEQLVVVNDHAAATLLPILVVKNKNAIAHHRAKKIVMNENDLLYLKSKTLNKESINKIIESFVMG